ncbi:MAG TPA: acetyl-CoA carboxylase biotin carboxylase subunit [Candidatus Polarisedimenticolaceae bacterium]|nr:acetyl-CoA carboxylase biotin carboxylase subunit [Candidatus Polarisedimenticolaceae bacterium]
MFKRVLIANRGEIAARIVRTCRRLGVEAVVAHSEADTGAPWLADAAAAVCIGPAPARQSYLDADSVLQAAEQTGCQAIHPGYGFLSENAVFAARCAQHGFAFVGPSATAIRRMGDKIEAKRTMAAAGVPTIPGSNGAVAGLEEAEQAAAKAGYPVLLKAAAGGGGKGMRRCDRAADLASAFAEASREAEAAFGDARLYLEKLVEGGRHVEFQVLGDAYGHAIHLGERECSIQRHHQKLVEESPSPALTPGERDALGHRAAAAAASFGYRNAGTLEFLRAPDGALYFMEMNTRLQVEHPVTEMVTGLDLVEQQLMIAAGRPLALRQDDVTASGHAIELRINAEDPDAGFRPDPGLCTALAVPERVGHGSVRWDGGIAAGWRVPANYDSLVGKLIVHAGTRAAAIAAGKEALRGLRIEGIKTTIPFHLRLLDDPDFVRGAYDVLWLERAGV